MATPINTSTLLLSLLAPKSVNVRPDLEGVSVKDGVAAATDGKLLGTMPESGGFTGFLPTAACAAVLKGVKQTHTFAIDGEFLTRSDGVAFKIIEDKHRGDFPDHAQVMRDVSNFEIAEAIKLDLGLLGRFHDFLKRSGLDTGVVLAFGDHLAPVMLTSGEFTGVLMPMRR